MTPEQAGHDAAEAVREHDPDAMEKAFAGLAQRMKQQHRRDMFLVVGLGIFIIATMGTALLQVSGDNAEQAEKDAEARTEQAEETATALAAASNGADKNTRDAALKNCQDLNDTRKTARRSLKREQRRTDAQVAAGIFEAGAFGLTQGEFNRLLAQAKRDRKKDIRANHAIPCDSRFPPVLAGGQNAEDE